MLAVNHIDPIAPETTTRTCATRVFPLLSGVGGMRNTNSAVGSNEEFDAMHRSPALNGGSPTIPIDELSASLSDPVLAALLQSSRDCIKVLDLTGRIRYMNPMGLSARQLSADTDVIGRHWWDLWPEESHSMVQDATGKGASGDSTDFRGFCPTARGRPKWWDVRMVPIRNGAGEVTGVLVVSKDVTDAVTNRKMYDTIALEMRHRLKNAFAVASAIAKISARQTPEHQPFAEDLVKRFSSLAVAQGKLVDAASDFPLRALVSDLVDAAGVSEETIDVSGLPDCLVDEAQMRVIAVVIGELTTNSLKYGALRNGGAIYCQGRIEDEWLHLSWIEPLEDASEGQTETSSSTNTGLAVIQRIVTSAGGQVSRVMNQDGLRVDFSLVHQQADASSD
ncbi:putative sensory box sensor histidine kinase [Hyphomonas neptunium ATCC 15444]|uniref:histidine kinase n=2 Tax=Hyphomonas TaxID=85 RepID=Q0BZP8_HYPNA|nr:putative sensory box sensor histidine kinase [Hyphomonas neptunium ATCC 15444]